MKNNRVDMIIRKEKITYLPLDSIKVNRNQPRRRFDKEKLSELAESIKENGLLQPITVRRENKEYMLIAGERRLRACHIAGVLKIACIVIEADENKSATLALLENLQRADLNFMEEAEGIAHIMRVCKYTQEQVAKKLGKTQAAISNKLRLLRIPTEVSSKLIENGMCERHARAILKLKSREEMYSAVECIIENKMNVNDAEAYIDSILKNKRETEKEEKRQQQRYIIKDVRLFYNTVGRALDTMRRAGIRTDFVRDEDETSINMSIKIFK